MSDVVGERGREPDREITLGELRRLQRRLALERWFRDNDWPAFVVALCVAGWILWIYLQVSR